MCISNKFPIKAEAAGPGITLRTLLQDIEQNGIISTYKFYFYGGKKFKVSIRKGATTTKQIMRKNNAI